MIPNTAGQSVSKQLTALDGTPFTGTVHVWITGDGGTQALGSVAAGLCVHEGNGLHSYTTSAADTNYLKHIAFTFVGTGAVSVTAQFGLPYTMLRGQAAQIIGCQMTTLTDGSDFSGAVTVRVTGDNGTQALGGNGAGVCALKGHGYYSYSTALSDTTFTNIAFTFIGVGAITQTLDIETISTAQAGALATLAASPVRLVFTIIKNALNALAVYSPREPIKPEDADYCLSQFNQILDDWNADTQASYAETFVPLVTTGANPETIGPTGTFTMDLRPVSIDGLAYDLGTGIYKGVFVTNDPKWWASQSPSVGGSLFGAYYEAAEPDGKLYFSSVLATGTPLRLMLRTTLGPVRLTDALTLPQGYESALTLTLQEAIADTFHATVTPQMAARAGKARGRIFANNLVVPSLRAPVGTPGLSRGYWDFYSRTWR